jgi:hypothetical protein
MNFRVAITILVFAQNINASPLFEEHIDQALAVEIETDLEKIRNQRTAYHTSTKNYLNGSFQLGGKAFDIKVQTRGHNRLANCPFPPLKIYFDKSDIKDGLLKHNHELKLVTHCQEDKLQLLFREHLVYRIYNLITPYSFQVRLLKVRYVDTNGKQEYSEESYAFFIESCNSVEKRLKLDELKSDDDFNLKTYTGVSENWLNTPQVNLQDAFQHLMRNNDWVIFYVEPTKSFSLANIKFFGNEKEGFPFPYDFDLAGIVGWDNDTYEYRHGYENLCQNVAMKKAFTSILNYKELYVQLLDRDAFLQPDYKSKFAEYLNQFESADDFCSKMDSTNELFSSVATSS